MNIFSTEGRIGRLKYFLWLLALTIVASIIMAFFSISMDSGSYAIIGVPLWILTVFPAAKRLHDLNKSGWLWLLSLIPLVNLILGIYLLFGKGTDGPNVYGKETVFPWPNFKIGIACKNTVVGTETHGG